MKSRKMNCFVAIGANLGDPLSTINRAIRLISANSNIRFLRISDLYKTEPIGPAQPDFLNAALKIQTDLPAEELLRVLLKIERALGRIRRRKWGPRVVDLDLLTYGFKVTRQPQLTLPHPRYHRRRFVLVPLCDIAARALHPRLHLTHRHLLSKLTLQGQRVTITASWNGKRFVPFKPKKKNASRSSR
jgi:2-amino-4-hydroxy-6-hydroxymethyldihydropteridine diphosphokinase